MYSIQYTHHQYAQYTVYTPAGTFVHVCTRIAFKTSIWYSNGSLRSIKLVLLALQTKMHWMLGNGNNKLIFSLLDSWFELFLGNICRIIANKPIICLSWHMKIPTNYLSTLAHEKDHWELCQGRIFQSFEMCQNSFQGHGHLPKLMEKVKWQFLISKLTVKWWIKG